MNPFIPVSPTTVLTDKISTKLPVIVPEDIKFLLTILVDRNLFEENTDPLMSVLSYTDPSVLAQSNTLSTTVFPYTSPLATVCHANTANASTGDVLLCPADCDTKLLAKSLSHKIELGAAVFTPTSWYSVV
jgi:hypothetical protein